MSSQQFAHLLEEARRLITRAGMDGLWLTISGGEPFMNEELLDMVQMAQSQSVRGVAIVTNGTLIDDTTAMRLASLGVSEVMISLDGASERTHDAIRGRGSYARTMEGLNALMKNSPNTFVGCTLTLTTVNMNEIEHYVESAFSLGFNYAWINPPLYCGRIVDSKISIPYEEHMRVMNLARQLDTKYFRLGFGVYYNIPYYPLTDPVSPYLDLSTACPWGRNNLTVTADGSVLPCLYSRDFQLGNAFETPLADLYEAPALMGYRDGSLLAEPCRTCSHRDFCGGCRARTYYLVGDWFAADPWCPLVRGATEETIKVIPPIRKMI